MNKILQNTFISILVPEIHVSEIPAFFSADNVYFGDEDEG
jgi:hypothetical protein